MQGRLCEVGLVRGRMVSVSSLEGLGGVEGVEVTQEHFICHAERSEAKHPPRNVNYCEDD